MGLYSAEVYKRKGRTIDSIDYDLERHGPCQIMGKVSGMTQIIITDYKAKKTGSSKNPFFHYNGEFKSGYDAMSSVKATVLAFDGHEQDDVEMLHGKLNLVSHPFIIKSLGYESGVVRHNEYILLALSYFEETFAAYMEKSCKRTMQFGRFTEEFIALIECVVIALLKLHDSGFYCPKLTGRYITVVKENSKAKAMLLDFCLLEKGNENGKDNDWVRLGLMLKKTAMNHNALGTEIEDLVRNLRNGTLKGMDILKHSALLSIRKKFQNVLSLNTFALTHCKKTCVSNPIPNHQLHCGATDETNINATEQLHCNSSYEAKVIAIQNLLDSNVGWKSNIPSWIRKRIIELNFKVPKGDTFRDFVWLIRCLIEHEDKYLGETTKIVSSREFQYTDGTDLESEIQKAWSFLFLNCQKFATSLGLKY